MTSFLKKILLPLLAISAILLPAFLNGYPLLSHDTATYLYSGKEGFMPADRPYYYGLFMRHISLNYSLWFVILAQAVLSFGVIILFIKESLSVKTENALWVSSIIVIVLSGLSSLSNFASNAMADIFTGLGFLAIITLLFFQTGRAASVFLWIVFLFSMVTHLSHVPIYGLTICCFILISLLSKQKRKFKLLIKPLAMLASCALFLPGLNLLFFGKFVTSESSYVFMMGKMAQQGILQRYLAAHCAEAPPDLCNTPVPTSPVYFVWSPESPVYQQCPAPATTIENEQLYTCLRYKNPIYKQTLIKMFADKALRNDMIKMFMIDAGREFVSYKTEDQFFDERPKNLEAGVYSHLTFMFPNEVEQIKRTTQFRGAMDFTVLNKIILVCLIVSGLAALALLYFYPPCRHAFAYLFVFLVINAAICGGLSDVIERYQARVWWLLPLFALVFAVAFMRERKVKRQAEMIA